MVSPQVNATQIAVDDTDPALHYSTIGWQPGGVPQEYKGTTHGASSDGASVSYTFSGISISVYGTTDGASCFMQYTLDAQNLTSSTPTTSSSTPNVLFYTSPPLSAGGEHLLTITRPSSASASPLFPSATAVGSASATMSPAASTGHTTINTTPTIIGAVVGGMAVILLATAAVLFLRSCLRARSRDETEDRRWMRESPAAPRVIADVEAQAVNPFGVPSGHHANAIVLSGPSAFGAGDSNTSSSFVAPAVLRPTIAIPTHRTLDPFLVQSTTTTPRKKDSPAKVVRGARVQGDSPAYDES